MKFAVRYGEDATSKRVCDAIRAHRHETARSIVDAVFDATGGFRGHAPQNDDMTGAAVKIAA